MFTKLHIYDLDGVLVDSSHRTKRSLGGTVDLQHWFKHDTEAEIKKDTLLPMARNYKSDLKNPSVYVVIATARELQAQDFRYIKTNLGYPNKAIYKTALTRYIHDWDFKKRELRKFINLKQFAPLQKRFWDDNARNVYAIADLNIQSYLISS